MNSSSKLYSRREALGAIGLLALACHPLLTATATPKKRRMALQLYTLRDPAKKDLADTLKKARAMGWEYVQWSGMPNLPAEKIRAELDAAGLKAIVLPAFTLSLFQMTLVLRLVRSQMLEVLRTDYIKFARARGLTNRAVHFRHALKNTLLPVITVIGIQVGGLIAFSIITETVFQWPGMGLLFIQSVQFADIPVMAAYLCLIALVFVLINLVVDLLYFAVDPRLRIERVAGAH